MISTETPPPCQHHRFLHAKLPILHRLVVEGVRQEGEFAAAGANKFLCRDLTDQHVVGHHTAYGVGVAWIGVVDQNDRNVRGACRGHVIGGVFHGAEQNACHVHLDQQTDHIALALFV